MNKMLDLFGDRSSLDNGARSDLDFYETPAWMTRSLLHFHPAIIGTTVLECACGRNAITRVLRQEAGCTVFTNDIDPQMPADNHFDAAVPEYWLDFAPSVDYVISNFPFNVAFRILPHALSHARLGVAVVLRKTFDEPTEDRGEWLHQNPWTRSIRQPRHKFRAGSEHSDSTTADWFLWEHNPDRSLRPVEIDHLAKSRRTAECS